MNKNKNMFMQKARLIAICIACAASAVLASADNARSSESLARNKEVLTQASAISLSLATNCNAVARIMLPAVRKEWIGFLKGMKHDGKQFFLPDFFKVKYVMLGGYDATGYLMGLYNPFYDAFALFQVGDKGGKLQIEALRIATTAMLCNRADDGFPSALGTAAPDEYFPLFKKQVENAQNAFYSAFRDRGFRDSLARIKLLSESDVRKLQEISKLRLGQALAIGEQKRVFADAVTADLVIKGDIKGDVVATGPSTELTLQTLATKIPALRNGFRPVAYFPTGNASNIIYVNPCLPTLHLHANISNGKVGLRMFDANVAAGMKRNGK